MTENEQKLRAAAVLMVGVNDSIQELTKLRDTMIRMGALGEADGLVATNLINVLIETHPENN